MKSSGIYKIQSIIKPDRIYVGSAVNLEERWRKHKQHLRKQCHHNPKIQHHYNKYGEADLEFKVIVCCDKETLIAYEQFYIDALNPYFNICRNAGNTLGQKPWLGRKMSEETKKKLSIANKGKRKGIKGKPLSPERIQHLREINTGRKMSLESRQKMSAAKKGKPRAGRPHTEESKRKMSIARMGNKNALGAKRSPEVILQMSQRMKGKPSPFKGKHMTEEHKAKMIESRQRNRLLKELLQNTPSHV